MHWKHSLAPCLFAATLSGCGSIVATPYSADYEALDRLKTTSPDHVAVSPVNPTDPSAKVNRIPLRSTYLVGPKGTFSQYLQDALTQDLREISIYDPAASLRIEATLLKNSLDLSSPGPLGGSGEMEVEITVLRNGAVVIKKTYAASTQFESSFAAAIAVPKGQTEYASLVRALLGKVYADPAFINAIKKT